MEHERSLCASKPGRIVVHTPVRCHAGIVSDCSIDPLLVVQHAEAWCRKGRRGGFQRGVKKGGARSDGVAPQESFHEYKKVPIQCKAPKCPPTSLNSTSAITAGVSCWRRVSG